MYIKIIKGVGWNRGMEGKIFRVLSPEDGNVASNFKGVWPIAHPDNSNDSVKVIKKHYAEIVEEELLMELSKSNLLSQDDALKTYELAVKLAKVAGVSADEIIELIRNVQHVYNESPPAINSQIETPKKKSKRAAVVEFAEKFIEDLKCEGKRGKYGWEYRQNRSGKGFHFNGSGAAYNVQFIINNKKRTVVCLLRAYNNPNKILRRGKARCAAEDCFNDKIGKAISLAKALKEQIPNEFINTPQPEGFQAGDIVKYHDNDQSIYLIIEVISDVTFSIYSYPEKRYLGKCGKPFKVVDDSAR